MLLHAEETNMDQQSRHVCCWTTLCLELLVSRDCVSVERISVNRRVTRQTGNLFCFATAVSRLRFTHGYQESRSRPVFVAYRSVGSNKMVRLVARTPIKSGRDGLQYQFFKVAETREFLRHGSFCLSMKADACNSCRVHRKLPLFCRFITFNIRISNIRMRYISSIIF